MIQRIVLFFTLRQLKALGHSLRRAVSEPLIAAPDQHFSFGDPRIIDAALPPQSKGNRMLLWLSLVAFLYVLGLDSDGDFFAVGNFDDGQAV
jgi:hypothetical protein